MSIWAPMMILVAVLIVVIGLFAMKMGKKQKELLQKYPGYPKGYYKNQGMGIGIAIGTALGVAIDNIAVGIALGVAIGAAVGQSNETKHKDELRPLTDEEKELNKQKVIFTSGLLLVGVIAAVLVYFLNT